MYIIGINWYKRWYCINETKSGDYENESVKKQRAFGYESGTQKRSLGWNNHCTDRNRRLKLWIWWIIQEKDVDQQERAKGRTLAALG